MTGFVLSAGARWVTAGPALAGDDTDKAGPLGLLVVILLGIASYFLFRSMSRHLRRVREGFPVAPGPRAAGAGPVDPGVAPARANPPTPADAPAPAPASAPVPPPVPHNDHPSDT